MICSFAGCEIRLRVDNTCGFCRTHRAWSPTFRARVQRWKAFNKPKVAEGAARRNAKPDVKRRVREDRKKKYREDPEFRERTKALSKASKLKLTEEERQDRHYRMRFGLSLAEVLGRLAAQGGRCAMCGEPLAGMGRGPGLGVLDHCHKNGAVRGVLCGPCNTGLGQFEMLREAAERYLQVARDGLRPELTVGEVRTVGQSCPAREDAPD